MADWFESLLCRRFGLHFLQQGVEVRGGLVQGGDLGDGAGQVCGELIRGRRRWPWRRCGWRRRHPWRARQNRQTHYRVNFQSVLDISRGIDPAMGAIKDEWAGGLDANPRF